MKKENFVMNKKMVGITLISLVVTIIILLILASISLTLILGDGGLLSRAKNSTELYKQAEENDQIQLNNLYAELASATSSGINVEEMSDLIGQIVDNKLAQEKLNMYPVGSIYISENDKNPSEFIGGTWESYGQGRTLIGAGTNNGYTFTTGSTGTTVGATTNPLGEYNHTLTISETPSHTHTRGTMEIKGSFQSILYGGTGWALIVNESGAFEASRIELSTPDTMRIQYYETSSTVRHLTYFTASNSWTGETSSVGGDESHNNIQPYIVTYMWKRVS